MKKIGWTLLAGLCCASTAWAERIHQAGLAESRWVLETEHLSCHLIHKIPGYGEARFSRYAGKPVAFELAPTERSTQEKIRAVLLQFNPASWQHEEKPEPVAELDFHRGRKAITMQTAVAARTLQALQQGKTPTFLYDSLHNGFDQEIAAISPANFGNAYQKFLACEEKLPSVTSAEAKKREVFFDKSSIDLNEIAISTLRDIKESIMADDRIQSIKLSCFTDNLGRPDMNKKLAKQRCNTVRDYLLETGLAYSKISYKVYGTRFPAADNRTVAGRAKNRRVVVEFEYE